MPKETFIVDIYEIDFYDFKTFETIELSGDEVYAGRARQMPENINELILKKEFVEDVEIPENINLWYCIVKKLDKTKKYILGTIESICTDFLYYDRKDDDKLSVEDLNAAVKQGIITIDQMVAEFKKHLENTFKTINEL